MHATPLRLSLIAAAISLGAASAAFAQEASGQGYSDYWSNRYGQSTNYGSSLPQNQSDDYAQKVQQYQAQQDQYQDQQARYQAQRQAYADRADAWRQRRDAYDVRQGGYDAERRAYERERDAYDAEYGAGAWERRYGY
jgi:hypothetical protein